jgi:hypothetical protein
MGVIKILKCLEDCERRYHRVLIFTLIGPSGI